MKTYRKNSRRNPWRNYMQEPRVRREVIFSRLLLVVMPIMIVCLAMNITTRLSDTYTNSLDASQALDDAPKAAKNVDVVNLTADYMQHKTDDYSLQEAVDYDPGDVFTRADKKVMQQYRLIMDILLLIGAAALAVSALYYFLLLRWREKERLMQTFRRSALVFVPLLAFTSLCKIWPLLRSVTWGRLLTGLDHDNDLIWLMTEKGFFPLLTVLDLIFSGVMFALIGYFTWEVAGRRKMFRRGWYR